MAGIRPLMRWVLFLGRDGMWHVGGWSWCLRCMPGAPPPLPRPTTLAATTRANYVYKPPFWDRGGWWALLWARVHVPPQLPR